MHQDQKPTPEWLNTSFLQNALKSYKNDDAIEVLNFDVRAGFGEHFASAMFRSKIEFKSSKAELEVLSVVIKAKPGEEGIQLQNVSGGPLFENETRMYKETLPAMHQLFERCGMKIKFGPE